jgi:uncharacterized membrane protein
LKKRMINKYLKLKTEATEASKAREIRQLIRLEVMIDVLFALMIYKLFAFMPNPEADGFSINELIEVLSRSYLNYTVIAIGLVLVILYWGMNNLQFGNLERTDGWHATLAIFQVFTLMLYLYFVRMDVQLGNNVTLMQLQSLFLALAGAFAVASWHYAIRNGLVSDDPTELEKDKMYIKLLNEPIVSLLTFPLAWLGPLVWTLGWLLLIPVGYISRAVQQNMKSRKITSPGD